MKTNCGIYKITINNKIYVGSSCNLKSRKYQHLKMLKDNKHCNNYLQSAFNKYGDFKWEVLEYVEKICDKKELRRVILEKEQYYLDSYESYNNQKGYNICEKSNSSYGRKDSEETKNKKRLFMLGRKNWLGRKFSEEHRNNISKSLKNKKRSEETIEKMKKRKHSKETKIKIGNANRDRKLSEEHKKKISKYNKGKIPYNKGIPCSKEHKKKISESLSGRTQSEETINKRIRKLNKKVINLDTKEIFNSMKEAGIRYNIKNTSNIGLVCRGKRNISGGYRWAYYILEDIICL